MVSMKPHAALFLFLAATAPLQVLAAPVKSVAATALGQTYRARVEAIARDLLWSNALLLQASEEYEAAQSAIDKPRRNTDAVALRAEANVTKMALLGHMKTVRANALRLRAISPVPRPWKKTDDDLVEAAWEWSSGLDLMELWLQHPSNALQNEYAKHLRRGQTLLDGARRDLWARTDRAVRGKAYAD